jgi:hypothetical protein
MAPKASTVIKCETLIITWGENRSVLSLGQITRTSLQYKEV